MVLITLSGAQLTCHYDVSTVWRCLVVCSVERLAALGLSCASRAETGTMCAHTYINESEGGANEGIPVHVNLLVGHSGFHAH